MPEPVSTVLLVCESVLTEQIGRVSAIRIIDIIKVAPFATTAHFVVLTYLHSHFFDTARHSIKVEMVGRHGNEWKPVAGAPDQEFVYSYDVDRSAPGAYVLTTNVELQLAPIEPLGTFYIQALIDGKLVAQTPLTLLRKH